MIKILGFLGLFRIEEVFFSITELCMKLPKPLLDDISMGRCLPRALRKLASSTNKEKERISTTQSPCSPKRK